MCERESCVWWTIMWVYKYAVSVLNDGYRQSDLEVEAAVSAVGAILEARAASKRRGTTKPRIIRPTCTRRAAEPIHSDTEPSSELCAVTEPDVDLREGATIRVGSIAVAVAIRSCHARPSARTLLCTPSASPVIPLSKAATQFARAVTVLSAASSL